MIGSRDYTLLFAADDDQRRGNVGATLSRAFDDLAVTGLWLPEFRPNIYPLPRAAGVRADEEGERFDAAQFGLRLDRTGKGFDWSLSYFDGIDRDPSFRIRGFDTAGLDVTTVHRRTRVLGGDFATNIGAFGVRGEGAYQIPDSPTPTDAFDRREFVSAVLGADRNVTEHFNINVQYVLRHVIDYDDPRKLADPIAGSVATNASLLSNQLLRTQQGATLRVAYTALNDTLTVELTAAGFFTDGSTAVRPNLSYALTDSVKVVGGIDLFFGEPDTFFGQLRQNRTAYAELRYGF